MRFFAFDREIVAFVILVVLVSRCCIMAVFPKLPQSELLLSHKLLLRFSKLSELLLAALQNLWPAHAEKLRNL